MSRYVAWLGSLVFALCLLVACGGSDASAPDGGTAGSGATAGTSGSGGSGGTGGGQSSGGGGSGGTSGGSGGTSGGQSSGGDAGIAPEDGGADDAGPPGSGGNGSGAAPSSLSYSGSTSLARGVATTLTPSYDGVVESFRVSPELPVGLRIDEETGVISGTPTVRQSIRTYVVTATNAAGSTEASLRISVGPAPPTALSYDTPQSYAAGVAITTLSPTVSGDDLEFSVAPALPDGLSLSASTGDITGTPTTPQAAADYVVTASNESGDDDFTLRIEVADRMLANLTYSPNPAFYTVDIAIPPSAPTIDGTPTSFSVSPALPNGLDLDTSTGVISGTPTVVGGPTDYSITAQGPLNDTTFTLTLSTVSGAPTGLTYPGAPFDFPRNVAVTPQGPTVIGTITSYAVSPPLPTGLTFDSTTGVIGGTPTVQQASSTYTVTATNKNGSTQRMIAVGVSVEPPSGLAYSGAPFSFTEGVAAISGAPTVSGDDLSFESNPALPAGLTLDPSSGVISGTPQSAQAATSYEITASNINGSSQTTVSITIGVGAPFGLSYPSSSFSFFPNLAITPVNATVYGTVTSFSVTPPLPTGLSLDATTGMLSGTPTSTQTQASYQITATGPGGSDSVDITIEVVPMAPSGLSYPGKPYDFPRNVAISTITPSVTGTVSTWEIDPALPSGLTFDTGTGQISGTPTALTAATGYTVTASNVSGSVMDVFTLTVSVQPASGLSYPATTLMLTEGVAISAQTPTVSGDALTFGVSPALPNGLSLNTGNGQITGTPTTAQNSANYVVTASNANGSSQQTISIVVLIAPPSSLSYVGAPFSIPQGLNVSYFPTVSGTVASYSVTPALPDGLTLDLGTGEISGAPTTQQASAPYRITATNSTGSTSVDVDIAVSVPVYCPGELVGGYCWYYGGANESCTEVCASRGGIDLVGTVDYAGSGGTDGNCQAVLEALGEDDDDGTVENLAGAHGCASDWTNVANWIRYSSTTTADAKGTFVHRACACDLVPVPPAPSGLGYAGTPFSWPDNEAITPVSPTYSGTAETFAISPDLPDGLSLDTTTGEISGTPTTPVAASTYTVTAFGPGGEDSVDISIEITLSAPADLSYANAPFSFTGGVAIADQFPTVTGNVETYSVLPALPTGLSLDADTGVISGTPTTDQSATNYTVTATNASGFSSVVISITIVSTYCPGTTVGGYCWYYGGANQSCTQVCATRGGYDQAGTRDFAGSGGTNANCQAVLQALGEDDDNGAVENISGAYGCASDWSDVSNWVRYTTTTTEGATGTFIHRACACNFIPVPAAPTGLAYANAPFTFSQLIAITPQTPTVTGEMLTYSIAPSLPSGLSFDTATGQISGTPSSAQAATNYTVTATNAGGSDQVVISIQVVVPAPSNLSYANAPFGFFVDSTIPNQSPTVTGPVDTYTVLPALPTGLSLNGSSGVISGTPTVASSATNYTVTATNGSGSTQVVIQITVTAASCAGTAVGGYCWYYGASGQSCDTVCATHGGCDLTGTRDYAGSNGSNANCATVLTALGQGDGNGGGVENFSGAYGCASDWTDIAAHVRYTSTTTCSAAMTGGPYVHRACACAE